MAPRVSELRENPRERIDLSPSLLLSQNLFRNPDRRSLIVAQSQMQPLKGQRRNCVLNNIKLSLEELTVTIAATFTLTACVRKRIDWYWKVWPPDGAAAVAEKRITLLTDSGPGSGILLRCGSIWTAEGLVSAFSETFVTSTRTTGSPEVKSTAALAEKDWKQGLRSQIQVLAPGFGFGFMKDWATVSGPRLKEKMENLASMVSPHAEGKDEIKD